MRPTVCIFSSFFLFANVGSSYAADPQQLFGAILGEIQGQIQRKQQRRIRKRLQPLWQACAKGDVNACDAAATYSLNSQSRANLVRMRDLAVRRPQFERDWHACQNKDVAACRAALNYPALTDQGGRPCTLGAVGPLMQKAKRQNGVRILTFATTAWQTTHYAPAAKHLATPASMQKNAAS